MKLNKLLTLVLGAAMTAAPVLCAMGASRENTPSTDATADSNQDIKVAEENANDDARQISKDEVKDSGIADKNDKPTESGQKASEEEMQKAHEAMEKQMAECREKTEAIMAFIPEIVAEAKDGEKVYGNELKDLFRPQITQALMQGAQITEKNLKEPAYHLGRSIISRILIVKEAKARGFNLDMAKAKKQIANLKGTMPEDKFNMALEATGETEESITVKMAEEEMLNAFAETLAIVTDQEAEDFYKKNLELFNVMRASHILAMFPGAQERKVPTDEEKAACLDKINAAKARLDAGESFEDVARACSDCPSRERGGDLGDFKAGDMIPAFEEALKKLEEGEVSAPVETEYGYHLIKAGKCGIKSFDEVKDQIKKQLKSTKVEKAFYELSEKLMKDNEVKIFLSEPVPPPKKTLESK